MERKRETAFIVRSGNFGHVAAVIVPKEEQKRVRIPIGPFPTRKQAEDELELVKKQSDVEAFALAQFEKYKQNPFPKELFPQKVVIFKGKYGESVYLARTIEDFRNICLKEFKHNDEFGYYSYLGAGDRPVEPEYFNSLDKVPVDFREAAKRNIESYLSQLRNFNRSKELAKLRDAARNGDSQAACELIAEMRIGEYEGYEIIDPLEY